MFIILDELQLQPGRKLLTKFCLMTEAKSKNEFDSINNCGLSGDDNDNRCFYYNDTDKKLSVCLKFI